MPLKFEDNLVEGFGNAALGLCLVCVELQLLNLVLKLLEVGVFLDKRKYLAQTFAKFDQADSVLVQNCLLLRLHDHIQNRGYLPKVLLH